MNFLKFGNDLNCAGTVADYADSFVAKVVAGNRKEKKGRVVVSFILFRNQGKKGGEEVLVGTYVSSH